MGLGSIWRRSSAAGRLASGSRRAALLLAALCASGLPARAERGFSVLIVDNNTSAELFAKSADEPRFPASLTKLMTLYIVFEMLEQKRLSPSGKIRISAAAAAATPSKLEIALGEEIAVMDAVKALITKSANDIAIAVAENIAGSEPAFAQLMTKKAHQLGMKGTHFKNASGLPDNEQVTTARDMVTLAQRLNNDFPQLYKLFATKTFSYAGHTHRNHNNLLFNFAGTDGIKTGYISRAGFNLVTSVRRGNRHVIGAIFGGQTAGARDQLMRRLLTSALLKASDQPRKPALLARIGTSPPRLVRAPSEAAPAARPATPVIAESTSLPWLKSAAAPEAAETIKVKPAPLVVKPAPETANQPKTNPPIEIAAVRPNFVPPRKAAAAPTPEPPAANETAVAQRIQSETGPKRGLTPSTLQAQAEGISKGRPASQPVQVAGLPATAPNRLRPEASKTSTSTGDTGFLIQIGAYASIAEAERHLANAKTASAGVLDGHAPVTQGVTKDNRQLFRARFAGFNQASAANVCNRLRQQRIDCLVMKTE